MLENSADLDRELLPALTALFQAVALYALWILLGRLTTYTGQNVDALFISVSAMRADRAVRPDDAFQLFESFRFVVKILL